MAGEEHWLWHAGAPLLLLEMADDAGWHEAMTLGADISAGQSPQGRVPGGIWQAARADAGWALVSCVVVPPFDFARFELAPPGWTPA